MAMAERHLNAVYGDDLVDHRTFVIAGDGCLMEGINHEAIGLAGHLGLGRLIVAARQELQGLDPADFAAAHDRPIRHRAGFAELDQTGAEFLHLFGMPNFLFHATMAFAVLRQQGLPIGKADFDGQHDYPPGFRF